MRKYPIGIQTFSRVITDNYIYVDKTDLVWELAHFATFVFMSRPRRFGKSLLISTLESYWSGDKDLFKRLKLEVLEQEWEHYPVLHFDLSTTKHLSADEVREELGLQINEYEKIYGSNSLETTPGMRLGGVITRAREQTGKQVVVIVDEYDAPLLDVLHDDALLHETCEILQEFYQRLEKLEPYIRFCFITGITKFSQLSIFSTINNIKDVTLNPRFSAICGFTEEEVRTVFASDIERMAKEFGLSPENMYAKIKRMYDGYHFSANSPSVFNPFSLLNAFLDDDFQNYWFSSGTPMFLIRQLKHFHTDITSLENLEVTSDAFDQPTENMINALPLLYQSGYPTIKGYERETSK